MDELVQACHTVATALDVAADVIVGMKVEAIGELVLMAAAFVADQAAAVATFGAAEAAALLIEEGAKKPVNYLEQQLEQYIIGQVIEAAVDPLVEVVGRAVSGLVFQAAESALGVFGGGGVVRFPDRPECAGDARPDDARPRRDRRWPCASVSVQSRGGELRGGPHPTGEDHQP
ncbi:hypothetical protein [Kitasatospora sp. NPDC001175]|uniref:hypothetical protein n=1 Tax=Kitasatospora sp. NPDC001175 TaxID=3157103 RepID=UPI003D04C88D